MSDNVTPDQDEIVSSDSNSTSKDILNYRLYVPNIIKEINVDSVTFFKEDNTEDTVPNYKWNSDGEPITFRIDGTNGMRQPEISNLIEYDVFDEPKLNRLVLDYLRDENRDVDNPPYIGELHTFTDDDNSGIVTKILKVIFPNALLAEEYGYTRLIIYNSNETRDDNWAAPYSMVYIGRDRAKVSYIPSGIGSIVYTNNQEFSGVGDLILSIHESNYSIPHSDQFATLSATRYAMGQILSINKYNDVNFSYNIPYKNILMNRDHSVTFLGEYLYGGIK